MMNDRKPGFLTYLYSALIALLFAILLFVFSNVVNTESSVIPYLLMSVYDVANVILVLKFKPRYCFAPFATSVLTFFVLYKIVSISSVISMYKADGFLSDGEFSHSYGLDILMFSLIVSTFLFGVFIRFVLSRQKLKKVSKVSIRKFVTYLCIIIVVGVASLASWKIAEPYKDKYLEHVSTFSTEKWIDYPDSRINMYEDFKNQVDLVGMDIYEVYEILGSSDNKRADEEKVIYKMGDSPEGHHTLVLTVEYDIVSSYEVETEMFMADTVEKIQNKK